MTDAAIHTLCVGKSEVRWQVQKPASPRVPLLVSVWSGRSCCSYYVGRMPSDWGVALCWDKALGAGSGTDEEAERYCVLIDGDRLSCECKGFYRHGSCKHSSLSLVLLADGFLDGQQPCPACHGLGVPAAASQEDECCGACGGWGVVEG